MPSETPEPSGSGTDSPTSSAHLPRLRENLLKTVNYCLLFSLVGMSDASLGAALPGLTCLARTTEQRITFLFLFHEMAVLLVTLLIGGLNRSRDFITAETRCGRLGANLTLSTVALLMPGCFLLVTQCRSLSSLAFAFSLMGLLEGCLEYFCNIQMLCLYRGHAGPFLQAMFFCQSLGAFVSPLVIGSFMSVPPPREWLNCTLPDVTSSLMRPGASEISETAVVLVDDELEEFLTRVRYPFYVIAAIQAPIMIPMFVLTYKEAVIDSGPQLEILTSEDPLEEAERLSSNRSTACWVLLFAGMCAFALDGILGSYSSLIFAFSMRSVKTAEDRGRTAYLPATFWGFTMLGRLSGIFISVKIGSTGVLLMDMIGLLLSALLFMLGQDNIALLFVATLGTGFFVSHCMPALLSLTEQFIQVTKNAAICLVSSAAFGEAVLPVVMATLMHRISTGAYPIGHVLFVVAACCLTCLFIGLGHRANSGRAGGAVSEPAARLFLGKPPSEPADAVATAGAAAGDSTAEASDDKAPLTRQGPGDGLAANYGSQSLPLDH